MIHTIKKCTAFIGVLLAIVTTVIIPETAQSKNAESSNPLMQTSDLFLQYPVFDKIQDKHYEPAFELGMQQHLEEIAAITNNPEAPTIENTIIALENSGELLGRVSSIFFALVSANSNETMNHLRTKLAPKLSAHSDTIVLNDALFKRVKALHDQVDTLKVDQETKRLVRETYKNFVLAGAELSDTDKEKMKSLNAELAKLQAQFSKNVLEERNAKAVVIEDVTLLDGLSPQQLTAAKEAAKSRNMPDKYLITLLNTSGQPALASLKNRDVRKQVFEASLSRGSSGGEFDNRAILAKVAKIRAQRAKLMGFDNHAAFTLSDQTAQTTKAVNTILRQLAPAAVNNAKQEAKELQKLIDAEGGDFTLAPWDWDYYTEKLRAKKYSFDAAQLKPYLEMNNVLKNGVFYAAEKLYGITFKKRNDLPVYHPDVQVWEVFDKNGKTLALFIQDFYARDSKRGGAWMNAYIAQSGLKGTTPIIGNHLNIPKPAEGEPTLLTWDEVETMFHEFGHALHGMFSDVTYPSFAGTSVPRDFVEYPSQVNEMWATWPEVLSHYARHYNTGEQMPRELLDKVLASSQFNQGYGTTEYLASSLLDQAWHQASIDELPTNAAEVLAFEKQALQAAGVDLDVVPPRYRSTYFSHIIGGYSAGYYSYIWSEVLDADTVEWFKQNGGLKRENGDHFRETLLSKGGSDEAMVLFENFRGAQPEIKHLLKRKGLTITQ